MTLFVYQTFEINQTKFKEGLDNLQMMKEYRMKHYDHKVDILTPISGPDYTYAILASYEGLAEMELQNKIMFNDEEYLKMIGEFFLENVIQGSMNTQLFRSSEYTITKKQED